MAARGAAIGGYGNTNEGKIIAAALLDNYNKVVGVVRGDPSLQRDVGTLREEAAKKTAAGAVYNEGDVVMPKIANVKLLASPADGAKALATLPKGEELVVIGAEKNGFVNVQSGSGAGWVKKVLVVRPVEPVSGKDAGRRCSLRARKIREQSALDGDGAVAAGFTGCANMPWV